MLRLKPAVADFGSGHPYTALVPDLSGRRQSRGPGGRTCRTRRPTPPSGPDPGLPGGGPVCLPHAAPALEAGLPRSGAECVQAGAAPTPEPILTATPCPAAGVDPDDAFSTIPYEKGARSRGGAWARRLGRGGSGGREWGRGVVGGLCLAHARCPRLRRQCRCGVAVGAWRTLTRLHARPSLCSQAFTSCTTCKRWLGVRRGLRTFSRPTSRLSASRPPPARSSRRARAGRGPGGREGRGRGGAYCAGLAPF